MLLPKRVKYRRVQRGRMTGKATRGNVGVPGPVRPCCPGARLDHLRTDRGCPCRHDPLYQAWRQGLDQDLPRQAVTEKPAETRMGSGKGSPEYWVAVVKPGRILFELADVDEATAREALRLAMHKLPIKCKFVVREDSVKEDGTNEG